MSRLLTTAITIAACTGSTPHDGPHNKSGTGAWTGAVTAPGGAVEGDVLALDERGAVIAETPLVDGRYTFPTPPVARAILVRLSAPIVGAREVPIAGGAPSLTIAADDVARLHGTVVLPSGAAIDGTDLGITPTTPAPTTVLWADPKGALRAAMTTIPLAKPELDVALLRGRYRIALDRVSDGPKGTSASLGLERVEVHGTAVPIELGAAMLQIDTASDATFVLHAVP